jgi:hypothetical protein
LLSFSTHSVDLELVQVEVAVLVLKGGMDILFIVDESIFIFVSSDEEGAELLLTYLGEDLPDLPWVHLAIQIRVKR